MVNMTVQPKHILRGDIIEDVGRVGRVREIAFVPGEGYAFTVETEVEEGKCPYFNWRFRSDESVTLLSI